MNKVFIGGSRRITRLSECFRRQIDEIVNSRHDILVGDANGADKAVQKYLHHKDYNLVTIFYSGDRCRNNIGQWSQKSIQPEKQRRDFHFFAAKDRAMAEEASAGLMIWDRESVGTIMQALRLVRRKKPVAVFVNGIQKMYFIKDANDWERFINNYGGDVRGKIEEKVNSEEEYFGPRRHVNHSAQFKLDV